MSTAGPATLAQVQQPTTAITDDEQREADRKWNERIDYLCGRTNDVLVNIVRLHWEEGDWLNTALKDQRKYGSRVIERYVEDCTKRKIKTSISSVYKYCDFASKYSREEVERAIGRHITWHQLAGGGISIPTAEGRDKWELAVVEGKFDTDDEVVKAAREITQEEKAKLPTKARTAKGSKPVAKGANNAKAICRATTAICTDTVKKMDELHDAIKVIAKMEDGKPKEDLVVAVRDTFRIFIEVNKRLCSLEALKNDLLG